MHSSRHFMIAGGPTFLIFLQESWAFVFLLFHKLRANVEIQCQVAGKQRLKNETGFSSHLHALRTTVPLVMEDSPSSEFQVPTWPSLSYYNRISWEFGVGGNNRKIFPICLYSQGHPFLLFRPQRLLLESFVGTPSFKLLLRSRQRVSQEQQKNFLSTTCFIISGIQKKRKRNKHLFEYVPNLKNF